MLVVVLLLAMLKLTMSDVLPTEAITPGICIAATASGTGKTTIATGLMAALAKRMKVAPFKVGPDYIDPSYHGLAAGQIGRNLDAIMCGDHRIGPLYAHGSAGSDIAVVEGVMGLFDGRLIDGKGSTADIAHILGLPVLLVIDVRGMSQSVGAVVHGFVQASPTVTIAGVILNKVGSPRHAKVCKTAVEAVGIPVLGIIPRQSKVKVPSRHLGLITAKEHGDSATAAVAMMAKLVEEHCDLDQIIAIAACSYRGPVWNPTAEVPKVANPTIAFASGPVFSFAYAEHRELLVAAGATVVEFDPLVDPLPTCDGLIIPGGFPEEHVDKLAQRTELQEAIIAHVDAGKPVHGECAGLLWLLDALDDRPMLGVIGTQAAMGKRVRLGYRDAIACHDSVLYRAGEQVTGHEFHHTALAAQQVAGFEAAWEWAGFDGQLVTEGFVSKTIHASYLHCHPAAFPLAIARFVAACAENSRQ